MMLFTKMPQRIAAPSEERGGAHHEEGLHGPDNHLASRHPLALASADASDHLVAHNGVSTHLQ